MKRLIHITLAIALLSSVPALLSAKKAPSADDELMKKAIAYFYSRKFEMSELLFQEALKKNPENATAYSYLGDIFLQKKRYDGALQLYKRALDLNPENGDEYFRVGQIYYYKRQSEDAIVNFKRAYELNPKLKFALYHIGLTHLMLARDKQNTIVSWESYLAAAPEDPQYEKLRRAVELLKDPNFIIPKEGSDTSIEEALHLGGMALQRQPRAIEDRKADHEDKKTKYKLEDIERDDGL
ncbi:MAG TPA: tetratricopeptide repeat protein [Spirochaetota bacterium]|nr:tetratricopeptide repeat protein [Spirochaetota bacterium]HNT10794.1 tetratricopeptide repeat protein [Spirochaetota bacterium]